MALRALLLLLVAAVLSQGASADQAFRTYHNARFGYAIDYPVDLLLPQGEAENGDGQRFVSRDGEASLLVYGTYNALGRSLADLYQEAAQGDGAGGPARTLTYQVLRPAWFVVSGVAGGRIFYQKTLRDEDRFFSFVLEYPTGQRGTFDPVVQRLSRSFRP